MAEKSKLRKGSYKIRPSFTVDEDLFIKYREYCRKNGLNMSARIQNFLKGEVKND